MSLEKMLNSLLSNTKPECPVEAKHRKANARDRYHAKRLSKKLGIPLTIDRGFGWHCWIEYAHWDDDRFCTSWGEVREKLEEIEESETRGA